MTTGGGGVGVGGGLSASAWSMVGTNVINGSSLAPVVSTVGKGGMAGSV